MGTTLATLRVFGDRAVVAHVGDSRVYRLRDGELEQLTIDHSMRSYLRNSMGSTEVLPASLAHALTRALARNVDARADFSCIELEEGDVFLLCTDGVSNILEPRRVALTLSNPSAAHAAESLVQDAIDAGGRDNATAVVVRV